ncbi:hypothetical protein N7532_004824 [Penicillium argentinense]|uniref:Uncharacterized protein n=1 Tax=Penicillium argentinense TaxID=1131581 RepID=A0A9W9FCS9_9EURO|nr:uncharacterized protein N7532_004824 [Penicillium argentinense]KAJ5097823.1 hypothetical protein N7532_004824 [Penicillium argentinense]
MVFAHGGGAMPYLAIRIARVATLSYAGGIPSPKRWINPYVPLMQAVPGLTGIQDNGNSTDEDMTSIKYHNALEIFPRISNVLELKQGTHKAL